MTFSASFRELFSMRNQTVCVAYTKLVLNIAKLIIHVLWLNGSGKISTHLKLYNKWKCN